MGKKAVSTSANFIFLKLRCRCYMMLKYNKNPDVLEETSNFKKSHFWAPPWRGFIVKLGYAHPVEIVY